MTPSAVTPSEPNSNSIVSFEPTFITTSTQPPSRPSAASPTPSKRASPTPPSKQRSKKRKRETNHIVHQSTFRKPLWSYLHLELLTPSTLPSIPHPQRQPPPPQQQFPTSSQPHTNKATTPPKATLPDLDPLTTLSLLSTPLTHFLGLAGTSISLDILRIAGREVWVRVPRVDAGAVVAGVGGWVGYADGEVLGGGEERVRVGWRVRGRGEWVGALDGEGGGDLFGGGLRGEMEMTC